MVSASPMDELQRRFNSAAAKNLSATYLLDITGLGGGPWLTRIDMGNLEVSPYDETKSQPWDCSISVAAEDLEMIMDGKLSAMTAALSGMLSIDGELGLAMQLVPVFFNSENCDSY